MTPRPLHKWKSFWLGILTLSFLAWAWWDSTRCETQVYLFQDTLQIVHARGQLWLLHYSGGFSLQDWEYFHAERNYSGATGDWDSWEPWQRLAEHWFTIHKLPHWFLILLFLIPWLAFLAFLHRRMKRHAARTADLSRTA